MVACACVRVCVCVSACLCASLFSQSLASTPTLGFLHLSDQAEGNGWQQTLSHTLTRLVRVTLRWHFALRTCHLSAPGFFWGGGRL